MFWGVKVCIWWVDLSIWRFQNFDMCIKSACTLGSLKVIDQGCLKD